MKKKMMIFSLVGILLMGAVYAYAGGLGYGHGPRGKMGQEFWSSLTSDQKAKLQELRRKFVEETASLRGSMLTKRLELQALWRNSKTDEKTLREKEKELRDLQNQWREKWIEHRLEARKLLTPEQLASLPYGGWMKGSCVGFERGLRKGYGMGPHHWREND